MTYVLFWDIDGTLLTTARAGVFALEEASREILGVEPDFASLATAGLTDSEVAELAIRAVGQDPAESVVNAFLRCYERHLPDRLGWRAGRVLPGVRENLDALSARPDVTLLLLTGNTPAGARAKLSHYGLWDYFSGGEFCTAIEPRSAIARRAWSLAEQRSGGPPVPERVFVIGDTPADVECGRGIGARTIAVASGPYSVEELRACEPWLTFPELPDPKTFSERLGLEPASEREGAAR